MIGTVDIFYLNSPKWQ